MKLTIVKVIIVGLLLAACDTLSGSLPQATNTPLPAVQETTLTIEEGIKQMNGIELYYKVLGKGEPIVILHGGPGLDHTYLLPQMEQLADDYQLIFYDQRASGRSSGEAEPTSITIDKFVEDLEGLRQAFNLDKMNLIGHSWGGLLAMFYAIKYPHRLNSLILVGSAGASWEFRPAFGANLQRRMTADDRLTLNTLQGSEGFRQGTPEAMNAFLRALFRPYFYDRTLSDQLTTHFNEKTAMNNLAVNSLMWAHLGNYDLHTELAVIDSPTLIIHGNDDPMPATFVQKIHEHIRGSEFVMLENCGHFPYIETPEAFFGDVKEFLEK